MKTRNKLSVILMTVSLMILGLMSCKKEKPVPVALFSYTGADVAVPTTISFKNTSTDANTYAWDFGDNGTSTDKEPQHKYAVAGTFTVKLTATGDGGTNTASQIITILAAPVADFTYAVTLGSTITITFTNTTTAATSYSWDFGDNTAASIDKNPQHVYASSGTYTVKLSSTGNGVTSERVKTVIVQPFTYTGNTIQAPCLVSFTNFVTNATSYSWNFGTTDTSNSQSPAYTFTTGGTFNTKLTAKSKDGSYTNTQSITILPAPTSCVIGNRSILACPLVDSLGNNISTYSVGIEIFVGSGTSTPLQPYSSLWGGVTTGHFPLLYEYEPTVTIASSDWNKIYYVRIMDVNTPTGSPWTKVADISYVTFKPSDYATVANHYPATITLTNGTTQVTLALKWN
jgi:PKD repeat protein